MKPPCGFKKCKNVCVTRKDGSFGRYCTTCYKKRSESTARSRRNRLRRESVHKRAYQADACVVDTSKRQRRTIQTEHIRQVVTMPDGVSVVTHVYRHTHEASEEHNVMMIINRGCPSFASSVRHAFRFPTHVLEHCSLADEQMKHDDKHVYAMMATTSQGESTSLYKIGVSQCPTTRVAQLQTGNPYKIVLVWTSVKSSSIEAFRVERELHKAFQPLHIRGEWFCFDGSSRDEVVDALKQQEMCIRVGTTSRT